MYNKQPDSNNPKKVASMTTKNTPALVCITSLSVVLTACNSEDVKQALNPQRLNTCPDGLTQQAMLAAVNQARSQARTCGGDYFAAAPALTWNGYLAKSATAHAEDMAQNNYFEHDSQDGTTAHRRMQAAGYPRGGTGENISAGRTTLDATIEGWLKSEGHCGNIMNPKYQDFGMACASDKSSKYGTYWVQNFGYTY